MSIKKNWMVGVLLISLIFSVIASTLRERSIRKNYEDILAYSASAHVLVFELLRKQHFKNAEIESERALERLEFIFKDLKSKNPAVENFLILRNLPDQ